MNYSTESKWSSMLECILAKTGDPRIISGAYQFENEVTTARYIHSVEQIRSIMIDWLDELPSATEYHKNVSEFRRNQGNVHFKDPEGATEAALLYTKALYTASGNSRALALAHGNRAAAVYKCGEFQAAFNDCECALQLNHPKPNVILLRQATCSISLGNTAKLEECVEKLEKMEFDGKHKKLEQLRRNIGDMPNPIEASEPSEGKVDLVEKRQKILSTLARGRYVVTDEPIMPNEVIMSEDAIAFVPVIDQSHRVYYDNGEHYLNFVCENCAESDIVPFPCYLCQNISYCSPNCRDQHLSIHRYECEGYKVNLFLQVGIAHLAFRSFLVTFDKMLENLSSLIPDGIKLQQAEELWSAVMQTQRDGELMGLCTNYPVIEQSKDLTRYALTASMLCCYLRHKTNFFLDTRGSRETFMDSEAEWEIVVSSLLFRLISQMICNAHTIEGIVFQRPLMGMTCKRESLAVLMNYGSLLTAIYPRVSLYNHSCEANFRNRFDRAKLMVIASKKIDLKEEILNCYGITCRSMCRDERLAALKSQYGFTCDCIHCTNENDNVYLRLHSVRCKIKTCPTTYSMKTVRSCPRCYSPYDQTAYNHFVDTIELVHYFEVIFWLRY